MHVRHPGGWLFALCAVVYLVTANYSAQSIDVIAAEQPAWALASHGSLNLATLPHFTLPWYFSSHGGLYSDRFPAAILFLVPAYWLANSAGLSQFTVLPGVATAALVAAGTVVIMRQVFRQILTPRHAAVATAFFAFGTGTWSLAASAPWSHTYDQFLIAVALWACAHGRRKIGMLVSGFLVPGRPVFAVGVAAFGTTLAWYRRSWRSLWVFGVLTLPGVAALVAYNVAVFGRWSFSNGHELGGHLTPHVIDLPVNVLGTLASPSRGLLVLYPILIVLAVSGRSAWRSATDWERAAAVSAIAEVVVQLALNRYSGGEGFFGNRLMIEPLTLWAPLIARAAVITRGRRVGRFVPVLLVVGVAIHAFGAVTT